MVKRDERGVYMREYDKMTAGDLYDATDVELIKMRQEARGFLDELNRSVQDVKDGERLALCHKLFAKVGDGLWLQPPFYCDYGKNIEVGTNVYFNFNCVVLDVAKVIIGSNVLIGPNVQIYTASHPINVDERNSGQEFGKPIVVGDNVWIGGGAILCPGVTIGEKSIIAAGAVVTKNVSPSVMVGGNPAKLIRDLS